MSSSTERRGARLQLHEFELAVPANCEHFQDGSRLIIQGPTGIEILVSGGEVVPAQRSQASHVSVLDKLLQNAIRSVSEAAAHPELRTVSALTEEPFKGHRRWLASSVTLDNGTLFQQAVFLGSKSVLLVTFEAPNDLETREQARALFDGVDVVR